MAALPDSDFLSAQNLSAQNGNFWFADAVASLTRSPDKMALVNSACCSCEHVM
jgi:hypothetical protein